MKLSCSWSESVHDFRVEHDEQDDDNEHHDKQKSVDLVELNECKHVVSNGRRRVNALILSLRNIIFGFRYFLKLMEPNESSESASCSDGVGEGVRAILRAASTISNLVFA